MNEKPKHENRIIEKFNEIQNEILRIGWKGILEVYHPDNNIDNPESLKVFQLYKEIYENMKKRLVVELESESQK